METRPIFVEVAICLVAAFAVFGEPAVAASPPSASQPGNMELLETVIAHNTAAREKVKSVIVEVESVRTYMFDPAAIPTPTPISIPAGKRTDTLKGVLMKDGPYLRVDVDRTVEVREKHYREETYDSCCLNDNYFAQVPPGAPDLAGPRFVDQVKC